MRSTIPSTLATAGARRGLLLALAAVSAGAYAQTTYYVNGGCGDDAWTGLSPLCQPPHGPKRTIQAGIDASVSGDTVIVADGVYTGVGNRDLDFAGRNITLRSPSGDPTPCANRGFWIRRTIAGPGPRFDHAVAYDTVRGVTVLFGGAYPVSGETWEWDGSAWTLRGVTGPSLRYGHAMAFDSARGVTVLFGGWAGGWYWEGEGHYDGETWEWDGMIWTQRVTGGPGPRYAHAMAYDSLRGVTVLFGGGAGGYDQETWEWDGTTWMLRASDGPAPRDNHAMAYDSRHGVTVLFGGWAGALDGETWEWDGLTWTRRATDGPSPRILHAMAYDSVREVTVLFGGGPEDDYNDETWEWDGSKWTQRAAEGPSPRAWHAMAYDSGRRVAVLFGGTSGAFETPYRDTWEYAVRCIGDLNCDGAVNAFDIDPFVLALTKASEYVITYPECDLMLGDVNGDGFVDAFDIDPFVELLVGP